MPPSRLRGCVQANYQQLIPNLQIAYCIIRLPHAKVTTNSVNKLSTQFKAPYTSSNCKKLDVISKPLTFAGTSAFWGVLWAPVRILHPLWQGQVRDAENLAKPITQRVCAFAFVRVCMHMCVCAHVFTCVFGHLYMCACVYMCNLCVYMCTCVCASVSVCVRLCLYVCVRCVCVCVLVCVPSCLTAAIVV